MTFKELIDRLNTIDGVSAYVYKPIDVIVSASDDDTFKEGKEC